jgi:hypothetical protein
VYLLVGLQISSSNINTQMSPYPVTVDELDNLWTECTCPYSKIKMRTDFAEIVFETVAADLFEIMVRCSPSDQVQTHY